MAGTLSLEGSLQRTVTILQAIGSVKTVTRDKLSFNLINANDMPVVLLFPPDNPTAAQGTANFKEADYVTTAELLAQNMSATQIEALKKEIKDVLTDSVNAGLEGQCSGFFFEGYVHNIISLDSDYTHHVVFNLRYHMAGAH